MEGRIVKVLIESGVANNFISDQIVTALNLQIVPKAQFDELTLLDGSMVKAVGYV